MNRKNEIPLNIKIFPKYINSRPCVLMNAMNAKENTKPN